MGAVWKLTSKQYKRFLHDVAQQMHWDLNDYGKLVSSDLKQVTDIEKRDAFDELDSHFSCACSVCTRHKEQCTDE